MTPTPLAFSMPRLVDTLRLVSIMIMVTSARCARECQPSYHFLESETIAILGKVAYHVTAAIGGHGHASEVQVHLRPGEPLADPASVGSYPARSWRPATRLCRRRSVAGAQVA